MYLSAACQENATERWPRPSEAVLDTLAESRDSGCKREAPDHGQPPAFPRAAAEPARGRKDKNS